VIAQDETFPERLRGTLTARCDKRFEVLNASAGSWGIGNELAYLERFGTLHSDLVIWQIGSHDLLQRKSTSEAVGVNPQMPGEKPLCATTELISRYVMPRLSSASAADTLEATDDARGRFDQNMIWLTRGVGLIRKQGARVCIVHTPDRLDVARGPDDCLQEKYSSYRKEFRALARQLNVPVLDLVEEWKDRPGIAAAFRDDVHFSSEGNRIVAEGLEVFLKENQLLDALGTMRP
jgi:lysophospholipase L1-like esterase